MAIIDVDLLDASEERYLTYALSVVNSRALPDVRDGLKPVQRRILYAMWKQLRLLPDRPYRKSAAVVGEVLARFHPHGDTACYDALVRMAQDFNFRYPLIDGQGNFGSLDGDSAAAYRYTEARLTPLALEVIGDLQEETVAERPNFDQTHNEPVVLPSRVPQLLINGASGIAVGMATAIPPHNLKEVIKALMLLVEEPDIDDKKIYSIIKGPDFPTACSVVNSRQELRQIYADGRGAIRMRADYQVENGKRGKRHIVVQSIPYSVDKSVIVEKIADLIITNKIPVLTDVRDESTDEVRIVIELASNASPEKAMAYLYKHTPLQQNFNVNLTALVPTTNPLSGQPDRLSLRRMLEYFADFRLEVTQAKLRYEKAVLDKRIHLLEGLELILDAIPEVIKIVRQSKGRSDAASKLQKRFKLSLEQSFFIVDLRIYQLSRTNIEEIEAELRDKRKRVLEIEQILSSEKRLRTLVCDDLKRIADTYGDSRRSKIVSDTAEVELKEDEFIQHENVQVIVSVDGWIKRLGEKGDPQNTRLRQGDSLLFAAPASTKDLLALCSSNGNIFVTKVYDISATSGYGEPVQKRFKLQDGERITDCVLVTVSEITDEGRQILAFSKNGLGIRLPISLLAETKKSGRKVMKVKAGDALSGVRLICGKELVAISKKGYGIRFSLEEVPEQAQAGRGVILQKMPDDDSLQVLESVKPKYTLELVLAKGTTREIKVNAIESGVRAKRGKKVIQRGAPVIKCSGVKGR